MLGNCIATTGTLAVSEWLDISLLVSSGSSQWHQHWKREAILVLVSDSKCRSVLL